MCKMEDSETFKTMVQFECRGLEPVDFQPQVRPTTGYVILSYVKKKQDLLFLTIGLQRFLYHCKLLVYYKT